MDALTHEVQYVADMSKLTKAVAESRKQFQGATGPLDRMAATSDRIANTLEHAADASVKLGRIGKVGAIGGLLRGGGGLGGLGGMMPAAAPSGGGGGGAGGASGGAVASGITAGVAGAVTGALISGAVKAGAAFADTVGEVLESADKAGNSRVFDPQAYQRLAAAAKLYDTEIGQVEAASLKLRTELGKAQLNPELGRGLRALGVSAKELKNMRPEDQIGLISDKLGKVQKASNRAIIAEKVFGVGEARAILPLLEAGSDELKRAGDEAQRLGLVLSDETVEAAGATKDSLEALGARVDGFKTRLVAALLPSILQVTDSFVEGFDRMAGPIGEVTSELVTVLTPAIDAAIEIVSGLGELAADAIGPWSDFFGPVFAEVFAGVEDIVFQVIDILYELAETLGLTGEDSQVMADAGDAVAGALGWLFDQAAMVVDILAEMAGIVLDVAGLVWDLVAGVEESTGVFSGLADVITGTVGGALDYILGMLEDVSELFDLFGNGEWEKGFMKLGNALLDFILEPLRMLVRDIIWVADAISEDLVPDSVRSFAENTREKSAFYEADADGVEKKSRKQLREEARAERKAGQEQAKKDREAAAEEKRKQREAERAKKAERETSNERIKGLENEGRKLSGPGLVSLGAKDETGREISVWLGKRLDTGKIIGAANRLGLPSPSASPESVTLARQVATAQAPGLPLASLPPTVAPVLPAPAAAVRAPVDMLGAPGITMRSAAPAYAPPPQFTRVVIERLEVNVKGGADAAGLADFAEQVREITRDEIDRQVRDLEPTLNPGGLMG